MIDFELYQRAQEILEKRKQRYDPNYMLRMLDKLYRTYGMVRPGMLRTSGELPSVGSYHLWAATICGQLLARVWLARPSILKNVRWGTCKARDTVHQQILSQVPETLAHSDFLVLNQKLTVSIQPAVPITAYRSLAPLRKVCFEKKVYGDLELISLRCHWQDSGEFIRFFRRAINDCFLEYWLG